jgi:hypothetical protein
VEEELERFGEMVFTALLGTDVAAPIAAAARESLDRLRL